MKLQRLLSYTRKAVDDYKMIQPDDKIAIGVSGGKDSLALLYALKHLQRFYPHRFELCAITVDLGFEHFPIDGIRDLCQTLEIPYHVVFTDIGQVIFEQRQEKNPCSLCAKMRKGALNEKALELGCTKIAYGHHKEDIIETMMMSLFFEGRFYAFKPVTFLDRTGLYTIRPLMYVPEKEIKGFIRAHQISIVKSPCPADKNTKREDMKQLLIELNQKMPQVSDRMYHAILRSYQQDYQQDY